MKQHAFAVALLLFALLFSFPALAAKAKPLLWLSPDGTRTAEAICWYETEKECECLLTGPPELVFTISSLEDGVKRLSRMKLNGMPERPPKTTRIRMHLSYASPKRCVIEVEDLGFGEFFPSSGRVWREIWEG